MKLLKTFLWAWLICMVEMCFTVIWKVVMCSSTKTGTLNYVTLDFQGLIPQLRLRRRRNKPSWEHHIGWHLKSSEAKNTNSTPISTALVLLSGNCWLAKFLIGSYHRPRSKGSSEMMRTIIFLSPTTKIPYFWRSSWTALKETPKKDPHSNKSSKW